MDLKERFESITGDQIVAMRGEQETLRLDFKGWSEKDHHNRKSLSMAISGFSNSVGGLIIWGVDCRKGDDGIDHADQMLGLDSERVLNLLNEWTADAVSPRQPEVDHRQVRSSEGLGFVITYVPTTSGEPVMGYENRFYHRCGSRFMQMEQYHVAAAFNRRRTPEIEASYSFDRILQGHEYVVVARIWLKNTGVVSAENVAACLFVQQPCRLTFERYDSLAADDGLAISQPEWAVAAQITRNRSAERLYPGMKVPVGIVVLGKVGDLRRSEATCYRVGADLLCSNGPTRRWTDNILLEDVRRWIAGQSWANRERE